MNQTADPIDRLFEFTVSFAKGRLEEEGDFYPFGMVISTDGKFSAVHGEFSAVQGEVAPDVEQSPILDVYWSTAEALTRACADGGVAAAALLAPVTIPAELNSPVRNGIRVHIEAPGIARLIYVPYAPYADAGRTLELHEPLAVETPDAFFKA
ncbi:hypothetical protein [Luteibacter sp. ME-Dv--P-043b]|uniref:hypothetical protein n=1 Tax=Luteibacter sp. ME-Dv--P-043b TaxID=3040291 RepID=UPI0025531DCC|nr:hypothetical protein [Luteibacter sp. ME-Dv--P-043b]